MYICVCVFYVYLYISVYTYIWIYLHTYLTVYGMHICMCAYIQSAAVKDEKEEEVENVNITCNTLQVISTNTHAHINPISLGVSISKAWIWSKETPPGWFPFWVVSKWRSQEEEDRPSDRSSSSGLFNWKPLKQETHPGGKGSCDPIMWLFRGDVGPTLQHTATHSNRLNALEHAATHCNALEHPATHSNILHRFATHCSTHCSTRCNTLQRTTIRCTTLHHAALGCDILQHTHSLFFLKHTGQLGGSPASAGNSTKTKIDNTQITLNEEARRAVRSTSNQLSEPYEVAQHPYQRRWISSKCVQ